jgi:hypothetical protein
MLDFDAMSWEAARRDLALRFDRGREKRAFGLDTLGNMAGQAYSAFQKDPAAFYAPAAGAAAGAGLGLLSAHQRDPRRRNYFQRALTGAALGGLAGAGGKMLYDQATHVKPDGADPVVMARHEAAGAIDDQLGAIHGDEHVDQIRKRLGEGGGGPSGSAPSPRELISRGGEAIRDFFGGGRNGDIGATADALAKPLPRTASLFGLGMPSDHKVQGQDWIPALAGAAGAAGGVAGVGFSPHGALRYSLLAGGKTAPSQRLGGIAQGIRNYAGRGLEPIADVVDAVGRAGDRAGQFVRDRLVPGGAEGLRAAIGKGDADVAKTLDALRRRGFSLPDMLRHGGAETVTKTRQQFETLEQGFEEQIRKAYQQLAARKAQAAPAAAAPAAKGRGPKPVPPKPAPQGPDPIAFFEHQRRTAEENLKRLHGGGYVPAGASQPIPNPLATGGPNIPADPMAPPAAAGKGGGGGKGKGGETAARTSLEAPSRIVQRYALDAARPVGWGRRALGGTAGAVGGVAGSEWLLNKLDGGARVEDFIYDRLRKRTELENGGPQ